MDRKLAVILYADVAGYSRLTGADEERTHRILSAYLDLLTKLIGDHGGTVLHYAGDAVLAEFPSIVIAVTCAVEIQRSLAQRNREFPRDQRLEFRIGINLGDVIVDRDEIYGDGVNLAARLESLAEPGGICVSVAVHDQVADKLDVNFEDIGVHEVKNIARPVQAYRVTFDTPTRIPEDSQPSRDKPSIAVLPFANMSADPEQEFFADGIAEDLLTKLTNILGLFVIARNSSFRYKGTTVDVRQVAEELGVRYVLEGSVRKATNRVRVTAQLIDATTGLHVWADQYDRDLTDIFAVQDDVTANVVQALQVTLLEGEQARVWHRSTNNVEAWSCLTRAKAHFEDHMTMEDNRAGIELLERAVELDPNYASAWAWLGWLLSHEVRWRSADDPDAVMARAAQCADKALALDDGLAEAHMLLGFVHLLRHDFDEAIAHAERGMALGPSNADVVALLAFNLNWVGRPEEALAWVEKAMRLSPMSPSWFVMVRAHALRLLGRFEEAMKAYKAAIAATPGYISPYIGLTVCYAEMGREHDAQEQARKVLKLDPRFSIARYLSTPVYKDKALTERSARALRQAGLPD